MSDDARSVHTRRPPGRNKRRVLVVSNASPPGSNSESETAPTEPQQKLPPGYPRPLPSPAHPHPYEHFPQYGGSANSHIPPPLTTGFPYSRSNPGSLSSPSSASSPAVESTPPPSTPGLSGSTIQFNDEGTIRQDRIVPNISDRNDNTPQASRPRPYGSQVPNQRRYSSSGSRPALSPSTVHTPDSYSTPIPTHTYRASPMEKVNVLVTTDAENLHLVDITGAMTSAFIRERIFTKLQISDEDQSRFSIYLTEVGQFAIGEALTDEELFNLYKERGDSSGSLKLLVSHSSATVHEPAYERITTSTVNTIPPPVLPHAVIYSPLRPNRHTRIRQGSLSSTSEPHPAERGYEASVSDDLDHGDVDQGPRDARDYGRSAIHARALPIPMGRSSSPSGHGRSCSPATILSPERSMVSPDMQTYRSDMYHPNTGTSPMPGTSPQTSRQDNLHPLPPLPPDSYVSPAEPTPERERTFTGESQASYSERRFRGPQERGDADSERRQRDVRKGSGKHTRGPDSGHPDSRQKSEAWTMVPTDVPSSGYRNDRAATPQEGRNGRFPITSPSAMIPYRSGEPSRRKPKVVPSNWAVNWKHSMGPNKNDSKPAPQASSPSLMRHGAKSMSDMRGAFKNNGSMPSGRSSRPPQPPLPVLTRPHTGGSSAASPSLPSASSSGDTLSAHPELILSPEYARSNLSLAGYTRPSTTQASSNTNGTLGSSMQDPYPRPHSALGESSSSPFTQPRYIHSPQNSETYNGTAQPLSSGLNYGSVSSSYRDEHMRPFPQHSYNEQHTEVPVGTNATEYPYRGPRTPPRSPGGASSTTIGDAHNFGTGTAHPDLPGAAFARRGTLDEDSGTHTMRPGDLKWEGFIDEENAGEGTARPRPKPRTAPPVQQLPTPPPTVEIPTLSNGSTSTLINTFERSKLPSDDSDSEGGGGTLWARPPKTADSQSTSSQKPKLTGRPPLAPLVFPSTESHSPEPPMTAENARSPPANFPAPPNYIPPPPRTPKRTPAITSNSKKLKDRISKFDNNFDVTWAPRPPPEVMYERLEEYFPEHDLDKPVIDMPSGGASPTATEAPAVPAPQQRFKHKKSIRVVAAEHKRQMDRTSRGDNSQVAPLSRKRHTKMWGSKLEEVTTEQGKGPMSSTSSDSSPGGAKPIFRWVRGELIGKGTYGRVYLALNATTGEMIAVKQVEIPRTASDKDDSRQVSVVEALKLESETLKDLDHPHIVSYLGFEETPSFLSIFLEYVPGGSIASCLRKHGRFDEEVTKSFTGQILGGLEYLHSRGILHRDLKADNILVETTGICKISDFGISKRTDDINMAAAYTSMQGTVFWMAPEVINSKGKGYNSKIDIWSVGCVVFEMWTGQRPWSGQEAMAVLIHLYSTKQAPPVPDGINLSALADDFRLKCFAEDPDERPTAAELRKHQYLELQPGWAFNGFK